MAGYDRDNSRSFDFSNMAEPDFKSEKHKFGKLPEADEIASAAFNTGPDLENAAMWRKTFVASAGQRNSDASGMLGDFAVDEKNVLQSVRKTGDSFSQWLSDNSATAMAVGAGVAALGLGIAARRYGLGGLAKFASMETKAAEGVAIGRHTGKTALEPLYVNTGVWGKADLAAGQAVETAHLGPCVSVISKNGVMAHLNPDWQSVKEVNSFIKYLKQNTTVADRSVALVGGMDDAGQAYSQFRTSFDLVAHLRAGLQKEGFAVKFEDLYGMRQRRAMLGNDGVLKITDGWNPKYSRTFDFKK